MPFMTRIPSDLHRFGLKVELVPGWETRGSSSFAPAGVTCHWTAGPRGTTGRPSLNICVNGRTGLPGPLANVYLARDGVCVVLAAGRANHAGTGGYKGLVGNSAVYGIEAESGGDGDWTPAMREAYPRLVAALLSGLGRDASWAHGHHEWAPTRKIDIRDIIGAVRSGAAAILANPDVQEDDMPLTPADAALVADHVWSYNARSQLAPSSAGNLLASSADGVGIVLAAVRAIRPDVDEAELARQITPALAPAVIAALGESKGLTAEDVEAAVRRVFADAAA